MGGNFSKSHRGGKLVVFRGDRAIMKEIFQASKERIAQLNKAGVAQGRPGIAEPERQHLPVLTNMEEYEDWVEDATSYAMDRRLASQERNNEIVRREIEIENIFQPVTTKDGDTKECRHVMMLGAAGMGKTTLLRRIALYCGEEMLKEKLVIMLELRTLSLKEITIPSEVIQASIFSDLDRQRMKVRYQWILDNRDRIVFIVDSLDTLRFDLDNERPRIGYHTPATVDVILHNLLSRDLFPESLIVSSSREYKVRNLHPSVRPDRCVLLDGLREDSVKDLIDGFLGEDKGAKVKEHINTNCPNIWPLLSIPVVMIFSLIGFEQDGFKPATLSGILIKVFTCLIRSTHAHVKDILSVLKKLMPLALEGIRKGFVLFTPEDLHRFGLEPEEVTDLGILIPQSHGTFFSTKLMQNDRFFLYFNHQTQQEALAALHILSLCVVEFNTFVECEMWEIQFTVVRRLICGSLMNNDVLDAAQDITEISDVDQKKNILIRSLGVALKSLGAPLNQFDPENMAKILELFIDLSECREGVTELIRSSVKKIFFFRFPLSPSDVQAVAFVLKQSEYLEEINLFETSLNAEKVNILTTTITRSNFKTTLLGVSKFYCFSAAENIALKKIDVSGNENIGSRGMFHLGRFVKYSTLEELSANRCGLEPEHLENFAEGAEIATLKKLDVGSNGDIGSRGMFHLGRFVKDSTLEELSVENCHLKSEHLEKFAEGAENATLKKLDVGSNGDIGSRGMFHLGRFVKDSTLEELSVENCHLKSEHLEKFAEGAENATFRKLDVSRNDGLGPEGMHVLGKLVKDHEVKEVGAGDCNLNDENVQKFAEGLGEARFRKLDVSQNNTLGPEGMHVLGKLLKNHEVKEVVAMFCNPNEENVQKFAEGLGEAKLDSLNLCHDDAYLSLPGEEGYHCYNIAAYVPSLLNLLPRVNKEINLECWEINVTQQRELQDKLDEICSPTLSVTLGDELINPIELKARDSETETSDEASTSGASYLISPGTSTAPEKCDDETKSEVTTADAGYGAVETVRKAKVLFDYEPVEDDELTLKVGEIIIAVKDAYFGWFEGLLNGKRGIFPGSFVEMLKEDKEKKDQALPSANKETIKKMRKAKVLFDCEPAEDDEFTLKVGEIITEVEDADDELWPGGWCTGLLNGKRGVFLGCLVEILQEEKERKGPALPAANKETRKESQLEDDANSEVKNTSYEDDDRSESLTAAQESKKSEDTKSTEISDEASISGTGIRQGTAFASTQSDDETQLEATTSGEAHVNREAVETGTFDEASTSGTSNLISPGTSTAPEKSDDESKSESMTAMGADDSHGAVESGQLEDDADSEEANASDEDDVKAESITSTEESAEAKSAEISDKTSTSGTDIQQGTSFASKQSDDGTQLESTTSGEADTDREVAETDLTDETAILGTSIAEDEKAQLKSEARQDNVAGFIVMDETTQAGATEIFDKTSTSGTGIRQGTVVASTQSDDDNKLELTTSKEADADREADETGQLADETDLSPTTTSDTIDDESVWATIAVKHDEAEITGTFVRDIPDNELQQLEFQYSPLSTDKEIGQDGGNLYVDECSLSIPPSPLTNTQNLGISMLMDFKNLGVPADTIPVSPYLRVKFRENLPIPAKARVPTWFRPSEDSEHGIKIYKRYRDEVNKFTWCELQNEVTVQDDIIEFEVDHFCIFLAAIKEWLWGTGQIKLSHALLQNKQNFRNFESVFCYASPKSLFKEIIHEAEHFEEIHRDIFLMNTDRDAPVKMECYAANLHEFVPPQYLLTPSDIKTKEIVRFRFILQHRKRQKDEVDIRYIVDDFPASIAVTLPATKDDDQQAPGQKSQYATAAPHRQPGLIRVTTTEIEGAGPIRDLHLFGTGNTHDHRQYPNLPKHDRQVKRLKRDEEERRRQEVEEFNDAISEEASISSIETISSVDDSNEQTTGVQDVIPEIPSASCIKYNTLELHYVAMQSIRYGVGLRATAAITTAAFMDAGLITQENKALVVDHSKIKRAQEKVMNSLDEKFDELCKKGKIECIFFDGSQDVTKVLLTAENSDIQFPSIIKEEHYTVCSEPGGRYLYHFTPEKGSSNIKPAEVIADNLVDFLEKKGIDKSLQAIGGDSTIIHWVEVKLGRKLIWLICALHTNELPLRHLMKIVDGKTLSNNKWTGDIGKMLDIATTLEIDSSFEKISIGEPLIVLSENVVKDLSTDQAYGYRITEAIKTGKLPTDLALLEIGPVSHSRWLTTANRICRIWVSKHGLEGKALDNLRMIVEFIVGVYYPCWFNIKVKHSWVEGPRHILLQLRLVQLQRKTVVDAVLPTIQRSAWYAFSENIIQTLLCSDDIEERKAGVQKILDLRGGDDDTLGDRSVRPRKTPSINSDASSLVELIDWSDGVYEPPLTCKLTIPQVKCFIDSPMKVTQWPCHGQSIERCVKQVTEAAGKVYTHEKREGCIRGQEASRRIMSRNESKQDLMKLIV